VHSNVRRQCQKGVQVDVLLHLAQAMREMAVDAGAFQEGQQGFHLSGRAVGHLGWLPSRQQEGQGSRRPGVIIGKVDRLH
jgi:hypothetical protein